MPCTVFGSDKTDCQILDRIYQFNLTHPAFADTLNDQIYSKYRFNVEKRNAILWLIPHMYVLAKDAREYIRESYSNVNFLPRHEYNVNSQVLSGTIRGNHRTLRPLNDLLSPKLYNARLYKEHILSPFNPYNRRYYKYIETKRNDGLTRLNFRPKVYNTQLLSGYAIVDTQTGRILRALFNGEFDMINFRTEIQMADDSTKNTIPLRCTTAANFKFAGNRISAFVDAAYQNKYELPDTFGSESNRALMDSIRPIPLAQVDKRIYAEYDKLHQPDTTQVDTVEHHENVLKKIFWDTIGDNLVTPIAAESGNADFRITPIINPLYVRWSQSRGLSYKIKLRARYRFSQHRYLQLEPNIGYNFKIKKLYIDIPLRMIYNPKRNGYVELIYGTGNRIANGSVAESINHARSDTMIFKNEDIDKFDHNYIRLFNNIMIVDWLDIETGFVYHNYKAIAENEMQMFNMPTVYRTVSPMVGLKIRPWERGPLFSIDWEKGFKGEEKADIDYERIEVDASWKVVLPGMRRYNFRLGGGLYTRKHQDYFVDFANFSDNNLPEGWEDEWSGDFELLRSNLYNESKYYVRANASYDSPLLIGSRVPYLGKYIERERFYFSTAFVEHTRPYFELGYSFTNRYVSIGIFTSFHNLKMQRVGVDFEFELFRRW